MKNFIENKSEDLQNSNKVNKSNDKIDFKSNNFVIDALKLKNDNYYEEEIERIIKKYDFLISKYKNILEDTKKELSSYILSDEEKVQQIINKGIDNITKDEEKFVYEFYLNWKGLNNENKEPFEKTEEITLLNIFQEMSIYFVFKSISNILNDKNSYSTLKMAINDCEKTIIKLENEKEKTRLFSLDKNHITNENIDLLMKKCESLLKEGKTVRVGIDSSMDEQDNLDKANYLYTAKELDLVVKLEKLLKKYGKENFVKFNELKKFANNRDFSKGWTTKQVLRANALIDSIVYDIKKRKLTPFETILDLHKEISKIKYNESEDVEESRVIVGLVNKNKIVCSGYSSLLKAVIDRLEDERLKCDIIGCSFYKKSRKIGEHTHNLVYINDDKYDVEGYYACDITADANSNKKPYDFSHCMFPVSDLQKYKNMRYSQKFYKNRLDSLIIDIKEFEGYIKSNKMYKLAKKINLSKFLISSPEVVSKYNNRSKPISLEKYRHALYNLIVKDKNFVSDEFNEKIIDDIICKTKESAEETFEKSAKNSFVDNNNEKDVFKTKVTIKTEIKDFEK